MTRAAPTQTDEIISDGLCAQLLRLRDDTKVKTELMKYLGFRASGQAWTGMWQSAAARLLNNPSDIALVGVLVRDTAHNQKDVESAATRLAEGRATEVSISLPALYLPGGQIKILPDLIEQSQPRRED